MRAISLWQPWASLVFASHPVLGRFKLHETRHWPTFYRGPLAIHAAQKLVTDLDCDLLELLLETFGENWNLKLPRGRMLGTTKLTDCRGTDALDPDTLDRLAGNWEPGRYAWRLEEPSLFDDPPEVKGRQGFFQWHDPAWLPAEPEPVKLL